MMNREKWKQLLPVIQSFVDGKPIQCRRYSGHWEDTDSMYSVLHSEYRIRPDNIVDGTWSIKYIYQKPGFPSAAVMEGIAMWSGTNLDTPEWPKDYGYAYDAESETFTPNEESK